MRYYCSQQEVEFMYRDYHIIAQVSYDSHNYEVEDISIFDTRLHEAVDYTKLHDAEQSTILDQIDAELEELLS